MEMEGAAERAWNRNRNGSSEGDGSAAAAAASRQQGMGKSKVNGRSRSKGEDRDRGRGNSKEIVIYPEMLSPEVTLELVRRLAGQPLLQATCGSV
jgi:hypothetical protein